MDPFKRANFGRDYPDIEFPSYSILTVEQVAALRGELLRRCLVDICETFAYYIGSVENVKHVADWNATDQDFNLENLCHKLRIKPDNTLYIEWTANREFIAIDCRCLSSYWEYIWYPAIDDIVLFDKTCSWLVAIDPEGYIYYRTCEQTLG